MNLTQCGTCRAFYYRGDAHTCAPNWECWDLDEGDDREPGRFVHAKHAAEAACTFAERELFVGDTPFPEAIFNVRVRDPRTVDVTVWRIMARVTIDLVAEAVHG